MRIYIGKTLRAVSCPINGWEGGVHYTGPWLVQKEGGSYTNLLLVHIYKTGDLRGQRTEWYGSRKSETQYATIIPLPLYNLLLINNSTSFLKFWCKNLNKNLPLFERELYPC